MRCVIIVTFHAYFLRVEIPVPGGQFKISAFGIDDGLDISGLTLCIGRRRRCQAGEAFVNGLSGTGSLVFKTVSRVVRVTHQLGPFCAYFRNTGQCFTVVELSAMTATGE